MLSIQISKSVPSRKSLVKNQKSKIRTDSDKIDDPSGPIQSRTNGKRVNEQEAARGLDKHHWDRECSDEFSLKGFLNLREVLTGSEEQTEDPGGGGPDPEQSDGGMFSGMRGGCPNGLAEGGLG
jgi:hypothetical protein